MNEVQKNSVQMSSLKGSSIFWVLIKKICLSHETGIVQLRYKNGQKGIRSKTVDTTRAQAQAPMISKRASAYSCKGSSEAYHLQVRTSVLSRNSHSA